jgi:hypothetical protein
MLPIIAALEPREIFSSKEVNVQRYIRVLLPFLAGPFFSPHIISSLRAVNVGSGRSNRRIKSRKLATAMAALLAGLCLGATTAHAQMINWRGGTQPSVNPFNWNSADNWQNHTVPTVLANFGSNPGGNRGPITFSKDTMIGTLQINAPTYKFDLAGHNLTVTSAFLALNFGSTFTIEQGGSLMPGLIKALNKRTSVD